jgi:hypothetical protein
MLAERDGFAGAQGGVVQAAEERRQVGPHDGDGGQELADLGRAGDHAAVDFLGDLGCLPGDLADRVGGQDVQLDGVVQDAVEHCPLAGDGRSGRGLPVERERQGVERQGVDQDGPPVRLVQGSDLEGVTARPG